jgi:hypothetical protein
MVIQGTDAERRIERARYERLKFQVISIHLFFENHRSNDFRPLRMLG